MSDNSPQLAPPREVGTAVETLRVPGAPRRVQFEAETIISNAATSEEVEKKVQHLNIEGEETPNGFGRSNTFCVNKPKASNFFFEKIPPAKEKRSNS